MKWLARLEHNLGWITIGHLPLYVVTAQAILYVWSLLNPDAAGLLTLDPDAVLVGHEYWRVLTFLFGCPFRNAFAAFFYLYFQYLCGIALEEQWGSFAFTAFYLIGALSSIAAAFLARLTLPSAFFLNESIFLAFAAINPNFQILLFFVVPIRIKWLAWFTWARIIWGLIASSLLAKVAILLSLTHYFLFFSSTHVHDGMSAIRAWRHRRRFRDVKF